MKVKQVLILLITTFLIVQSFLISSDNMENTMTTLNTTSVAGWNDNASTWDELMGEGSSFQLQIVDQALEKLLPPLGNGSEVLEIACGNGFLARRFAKQGAGYCD